MADKLLPPFISTKLPAFDNSLVIEFDMNRSVGLSDITGMSLIIKTANSGKILQTLTTNTIPTYNQATGKYTIEFGNISGLQIGQYYKLQLAYIGGGSNDVGYYSSAGIIKKTTRPSLSLPSLDENLSNLYEYQGLYSQITYTDENNVKHVKDATEKLYSYRFDIYDLEDNLIDTSGECLYNVANDNENGQALCSWNSKVDLIKEVTYRLCFSIVTINGLKASVEQSIYAEESINITFPIELISELNYEDGTVNLYLQSKDFKNSIVTGDFVIVRSSNASNFNIWDRVYEFSYSNIAFNAKTKMHLWEDWSLQQGEEYLYAIQAFNQYIHSNRLTAKNGKIVADFEHCFLSDAEHQLKISFNPKISSFKNTVLESKVDTLGSKYPFIFRNGYVDYCEFPISGLLSLLTDENEKFMSFNRQQLMPQRIQTPGGGATKRLSTDLTSENIYNERMFKIEVLKWLNNGKPKIFRSPTEGNFIVRLMNNSLTPNDTLGRMLHSFNSTAYQIDDWSFDNLIKYKLVNVPKNKRAVLKIGQITPTDVLDSADSKTLTDRYPGFSVSSDQTKISFPHAYSVNITEAKPGSKFILYIQGQDNITVEIGGTGAYYLQIAQAPNANDSSYLSAVGVNNLTSWNGAKITFEYYDTTPRDTFSQISKIETKNEIRRYVGYNFNINIVRPTENAASDSVLADIRRDIGTFNFIKVEKRFIQETWKTADGKNFARNKHKTDIIKDDEWNDVIIYYVHDTGMYYDGKIDSNHRLNGTGSAPDCRFCLNDSVINFSDFTGREVNGPSDQVGELENPSSPYTESFGRMDAIRNVEVETLRVGNGLLLDIGYKVKEKSYGIEDTNDIIKKNKILWKRAIFELKELLRGYGYSKTTTVTESTYDDSIHYYISDGSYVKGGKFRSGDYYLRISKIPSQEDITRAQQKVYDNYKNYVQSLNAGLAGKG